MLNEQQVVEFIGHSTAALTQAAAIKAASEAVTARQKVASAKIPAVVDALIENGRINANQREKAAEVLRDPVQALEILLKVAAHRNEKEAAASLGKPVSPNYEKAASFKPIGGRSEALRPSDRHLFQALGLPVPD